ncbi:hypothetical protein SAMN05421594_4192 [Chryseobacterium oleae]|uniref:Uncharacterized protein n=1 Tax=Chryseobacterium oleae TaxID=491207 RepID=A0A1I5BUH1_CHROL|nr:hypothetical protein [Chryseobacterium oleae]SFN78337.1 hypothetical protein SAMN05421594_4192 [Chryseobacterium oleae]
MKNLTLESIASKARGMLSREELKQVMGSGLDFGTGSGETAICTYRFKDGHSETGVVTNPLGSGYSSAGAYAKAFCDNDQDCTSVSCQ